MASVNKVILVGHLGKDPEIKSTNSGDKIANMSVATSERWTDKQSGERREKTEWHNVVIFNESLVRVAEQYLRKGSKVYLEGQLQTRKWQDKTGADRWTTEVVLTKFRGEIVLLGDKADGRSDDGETKPNGGTRAAEKSGQRGLQGLDDDIPF